MNYLIRAIHVVENGATRAVDPSQLAKGQTIEVETISGFLPRVDPVTMKATTERQQFIVTSDGGGSMVPKERMSKKKSGRKRGY